MEPTHVLLLVSAGLLGGYIAGLTGLGGGIIFAPVLLFHFQSIGVDDGVVAQLTIGSSLMCTVLASLASARRHYAHGAVATRVAAVAGLASAASVIAVSLLVTTRPWFDADVFQTVFAVLLVAVALRMFLDRENNETPGEEPTDEEPTGEHGNRPSNRHGTGTLSAVGLIAGAVSTTAGVGGGIILVPTYKRLLKLPMHRAVGTSSATIVLIGLAGMINYALLGLGNTHTTPTSLGYVDVVRSALLASGAILSVPWGVATAHRLHSSTLRRGFAILVLVMALRLFL